MNQKLISEMTLTIEASKEYVTPQVAALLMICRRLDNLESTLDDIKCALGDIEVAVR